MEIALLNQRITFQRNIILTDRISNHTNSWEDDFSCFATVGGESGRNGKETAVAGTVIEDTDISFTVRWCEQTANIGSTSHRIIFKDEIYNIVSVDHMNYKKKCIKFRCRKVRR